MQDTDATPPETQETGSTRSQSPSQNCTSRSTPAAHCPPQSSPLSSLRSITPPYPSEDFKIDDSSTITQQPGSPLVAIAPSSSRSSTLLSSRPSSLFTRDENIKDIPFQSDSSEPSFSAKTDDITSATNFEFGRASQSSPPSSVSPIETPSETSTETATDVPQLSQASSTSRALPNLKGRDLFDCMVWSDPFTTSIFYMFISSLRQKIRTDVKSTTRTHKFLRTLRDGGRLVRCYTQNIDCLEEREGLVTNLALGAGSKARFSSRTQREPRPGPGLIDPGSPHNGGVECVLLHGSLVSLRCGICAKLCSWELAEHQSATLGGSAPDCPSCLRSSSERTGRGRRGLAVGRLRPDIVLYGEEHPDATLIAPLITHDLGLGPDCLLIMGTSLKVHGLKVMVKEFARAVHLKGGKVVFVNRTKPPESTWGEFIDYWVEWDCDLWVSDLQERRGDIWLPQGTVVESRSRRESEGASKAQKAAKAPRPQASRPQAVRDDKINGVYLVFKILDLLRHVKDTNGAEFSRPPYWEKVVKAMSAVPPEEPGKQARKSLPASKTSSKEAKSRKRKSCPSSLQEDKNDAAATQYREELRKIDPGLNATPPELGRIPLTLLDHNLNFSYHLSLKTHPPSGLDPSLFKSSPDHKSASYSYGASAQPSGVSADATSLEPLSRLSTGSAIVVDDSHSFLPHPSLLPANLNEDTIFVATPTSFDNDSLPPRPNTEPLTPNRQRMSIPAIVSPDDRSDSSSTTKSVYYDALERQTVLPNTH